MKLFRLALLVVGLLAWSVSDAEAAKKKVDKKPAAKVDQSADSKTTDSTEFLTAPLLPADTVTKLKLTAEQKPQVDKLQKEFAGLMKEVSDKLKALPAADPAKKPEKGKKGAKAANPATEVLQDALKTRGEYEDKVKELLTDKQKDVLDEINAKKAEALLNAGGTKTPAKK